MGSKANGSLIRLLGVWGHRYGANELADFARQDSCLSHPEESVWQAVACYVIAIASLINQPDDRVRAFDNAKRWADQYANPEVRGWLREAERQVQIPYYPQFGFIRIAFTHAFRHLLLGTNYVHALQDTLVGGGDTDTNACIVGGLIGAACSTSNLSNEMTQPVLNCDTRQGTHPRPALLSAAQLPVLARTLIAET